MSLKTEAKVKRRKQRQIKKALHKSLAVRKLAFLWKEFLGIEDVPKIYYPEHDPTVSNHKRVIGQRIMSGRIKPVAQDASS